MRRVEFHRYGPPEVLSLADVPAPRPRRGQVRVAVHAAGCNPKDVMVRKGRFKAFVGPRWPKTLGHDVAGVVDAVGPGVQGLAVGQPVFGMIQAWRAGGYAEQAVLPADQVAPLPPGLSFTDAAAVPLAALTALQALRDLIGLRPGDRVGLHGASGGVGVFAVQLAKALGAHVTATSSAANHDLLRALGADVTLDYRAADLFDHGPFDGVFDIFGNRRFGDACRALRRRGVYVNTVPEPRIIGQHLRTRFAGGQTARLVVVKSRGADLRHLAALVAAGQLRAVVDAVLPLDKAAEAHRRLETKRTRGKLVLQVR
ncbi:MAG: NADP-dependent oxidoreductase [Myxococcales bacterium]|nr:NADP-dependent oxidoreductase [Myxococcales bacterium]MCB9524116.1 NADP-dependent oxidoreductase [Myxococcales bacterium]